MKKQHEKNTMSCVKVQILLNIRCILTQISLMMKLIATLSEKVVFGSLEVDFRLYSTEIWMYDLKFQSQSIST